MKKQITMSPLRLKVNTIKGIHRNFSKQKCLQLMVLPGILWMLIFSYLPMAGLVTAFQEYDLIRGIFYSPFVGFAQFDELFSDNMFWMALRNSFGLSLVKIMFSLPAPIIFAILVNEITGKNLKRTVQTASYLPHFISWVVIAGLFKIWLDSRGVINDVLITLNFIDKPVYFLMDPKMFWILMAIIDTWKETGWWAILYLAAIAGIPQEVFESAVVDGASKLKQIFHIILPSIKNTIVIVFILSIGSLIYGGLSGSNFNQSLLFGSPVNYPSSEILDTFILRMGIQSARFSFATAAGMIQSVFSLVLFSSANWLSRKLSDSSLY